MKKKYIAIIIIAFFLLFFSLIYYKFQKSGNTITNKQDIVEKLLQNPIRYVAEIEVEIQSNKNKNKYKIKQEESENYSKQEIIEGKNIEGLIIELNNNILKIKNTTLNLEKIYEHYNDVSNNYLFLSTFLNECKNQDNKIEIEEDEENYKIKLELSNNLYIKEKELYISKKTSKPTKMLIEYSYHNQKTSILYTNIEIN